MTRMLVWLAAPVLCAAPLTAQEVWQADVQVQAIEVSQVRMGLFVRIVVFSDNDDAARNARVEILLPVGVAAVKMAGGCVASPSPNGTTQLTARIVCQLGDLPVRALREVWVQTTTPPPGVLKTFGAVALSDTPDPQPVNNHAERTIP